MEELLRERVYPLEEPTLDGEPYVETGYVLPFTHRPVVISQGYDGPHSHGVIRRGLNGHARLYDDRYCLDFALPVGSQVIAAKAGKVMGVVDDRTDYYGGLDFQIGMQQSSNSKLQK